MRLRGVGLDQGACGKARGVAYGGVGRDIGCPLYGAQYPMSFSAVWVIKRGGDGHGEGSLGCCALIWVRGGVGWCVV